MDMNVNVGWPIARYFFVMVTKSIKDLHSSVGESDYVEADLILCDTILVFQDYYGPIIVNHKKFSYFQ